MRVRPSEDPYFIVDQGGWMRISAVRLFGTSYFEFFPFVRFAVESKYVAASIALDSTSTKHIHEFLVDNRSMPPTSRWYVRIYFSFGMIVVFAQPDGVTEHAIADGVLLISIFLICFFNCILRFLGSWRAWLRTGWLLFDAFVSRRGSGVVVGSGDVIFYFTTSKLLLGWRHIYY